MKDEWEKKLNIRYLLSHFPKKTAGGSWKRFMIMWVKGKK